MVKKSRKEARNINFYNRKFQQKQI